MRSNGVHSSDEPATPQRRPRVSVVIPTYARIDLLHEAIASVLPARQAELIVVDNNSPDRIGQQISRTYGPNVRVVHMRRNTFYAGAVNAGFAAARGEILVALNDDAFIETDWVASILDTFDSNPRAGTVASLVIRREDGRVDSAGDQLDVSGRATNIGHGTAVSEHCKWRRVFSASGSCAAYRRSALQVSGLFDERFGGYYEDVDLGFRLQLAGFECIYNPQCRASHIGGATYKARRKAIFLTERNMVWNLVKNMPAELLVKHLRPILSAHAQPAPIDGGGSLRQWSAGKAAAALNLREMLAARRHIQGARSVSVAHIESMLVGSVPSVHL